MVKIVAIILLANFALVNLAFAQVPNVPVTPGPGPTLPGTPVPAPTPPAAPAPTNTNPNDEVVVTPAQFQQAQTSISACYEFAYNQRNGLSKTTGGNFKALWRTKQKTSVTFLPVGPGGVSLPVPTRVVGEPVLLTDPGPKCLIVPGSATAYKDSAGPQGREILGDFFSEPQPQGSKQLQTMLRDGKGITQRDITNNYIQDQIDKQKAGPVSSVIGWVLNAIFSVINIVIAHLTALAGAIFNQAVKWVLNQTIPDVVTVGWGIVRDFANMFFILILIVIALAAILRIESYDYRHLLGELVIMAVLVNFSKVIAVTLIHFVDLISIMFAPHGWGEIYGFIWNYTFKDLQSLPNGWMAGLAQGITKLMLSLVALVTFLALALLLVIRLVGLYVLIIFSPMAYVLDILPATKHYAHEWWEYFAKYLIWVPISFFMLRLTILLAKSPALESSDSAFSYVILMAFMWGSVIVAEHAGMVGGKAVVNVVEKGLHHGAEFVGRAYTKRINQSAQKATASGKTKTAAFYKAAAFLNPVVAKKAWEQRSHHLEEEIYGPAVGYAHDTLNRVMPTEWHAGEHGLGLGRKTNFGDMEYNRMLNKKVKEINEAPLTEKQRVEGYLGATHLDDKIAWSRALTLNNHQDGLMGYLGKAYDPVEYRKMLMNDLMHAGASLEQIGIEANYISELSEANKKLRDMGAGLEEDLDGKARATVDLTALTNLASNKGKTEKEAKEDFAKLQNYLREKNVINQNNEFIDKFGNSAGTVTTAEEFTKLLKTQTTAEDKLKGRNFEYEIMSARAAKEGLRRANRMDAEDLAKAIEPAGVAVQDGGKWEVLHGQGRRFLEGLNPSVGMAVPGMRRTQPRSQALVGAILNEDGTIDYRNLLREDETGKKRMDILVEMAHESPELAAGFLTKGRLEADVAKQIMDKVNKRLTADYNVNSSKRATKFLELGEEREGGIQFKITGQPGTGAGKGKGGKESDKGGGSTPASTARGGAVSNPNSGARSFEVGPDGTLRQP